MPGLGVDLGALPLNLSLFMVSRASGHSGEDGMGGHRSDSWQQVSPHPVGVMGPQLGHHSIPEPAPHAYTLTPTQLTSPLALRLEGTTGLLRCFGFSVHTLQFLGRRRSTSKWSPALCCPSQHLGQPKPLGHYCCFPSMASPEAQELLPVLPGLPCLPSSLVEHTLHQATPSVILDSGIRLSFPVLVSGAHIPRSQS